MRLLLTYSTLPHNALAALQWNSREVKPRCDFTTTHICAHTNARTQLEHAHTLAFTHPKYFVVCKLVPKQPQCSLKLQSSRWMEIGDTLKSYLPCWSSQWWRALTWVVRRRSGHHLWWPHHCNATNRGHGKDKGYHDDIFKDARVSHDIVWDRWGGRAPGKLHPRQFLWPECVIGSPLWWRPLTRLLNHSSTVSEREIPARIYCVKKADLANLAKVGG